MLIRRRGKASLSLSLSDFRLRCVQALGICGLEPVCRVLSSLSIPRCGAEVTYLWRFPITKLCIFEEFSAATQGIMLLDPFWLQLTL